MEAEWIGCKCGILVRAPDRICERCKKETSKDGTKPAVKLRSSYGVKGACSLKGYQADNND